MIMQQIRIGLIGCGAVMAWHVQNLLARADAAIVGLADPSPQQLAQLVARRPTLEGLPAFRSYEEMFAALELDAVEVATPHTLHYAVVKAALERGLHVLCEKPLACEAAHARELVALAKAGKQVLMVSYQRHFDPGYRYLRQQIASGGLGDLRSIGVRIGQNWQQLTQGTWRQDPALSGGGMLMDSGSHLVDVLLWLVDRPVVRVAALLDQAGTLVDITSTVLVEFSGGLQANLQIIGDLPALWLEEMLISGTRGMLRYQSDPQHPWREGVVEHWRGNELVRPLELPEAPTSDANWLDAIAGVAANEAPGTLGLQVALVTAAIYQAAQTGQVVRL
jgi:predicted dehydrogenase